MATRPNPFAGKKAPPFAKGGGGGGKAPPFEKSGRDVEAKGVKEGSPRDRAMDRRQMAAPPAGPPMGFRKGGRAKR